MAIVVENGRVCVCISEAMYVSACGHGRLTNPPNVQVAFELHHRKRLGRVPFESGTFRPCRIVTDLRRTELLTPPLLTVFG